MKIVKNLSSILFFLILISALYVYKITQGDLKKLNAHDLQYFEPCADPISYKIGTVDERFQISPKDVLKDVQFAANIWNKELNRELFVYKTDGDVPIDFVYDKRQGLSSKINQLKNKVDKSETQLKSEISQYEAQVAEFKTRLAALNAEIADWNSKNGAPPDVYERLKNEQNLLQIEADNLNAKAKTLNLSANNYNSQIGSLNQTISTFNSALSEKPEEGLFKGDTNSIEIYFVNGKNELIHTIAHELGHARGVDHNEGKNSIMHPFTNESIKLSSLDIESMKNYCAPVSYLEIFKQRLETVISIYRSKLQI